MMSLEPIPAEVTEGRLKAADVVHSVFASLFPSGRSQDGDAGNAVEVASQGLEASRWAPQKTTASSRGRGPADSPKTSSRGLTDSIWAPKKNNEPKGKVAVPSPQPSSSSLPPSQPQPRASCVDNPSFQPSPSTSLPRVPSDLSCTARCASSRAVLGEPSNMYRPANLDDTAGFMAAVRALRQNGQIIASPVDKDASSGQKDHPRPSSSRVGSPTAAEFVPSSASSSLAGNPGGSPAAKNDFTKPSGSFVGNPAAPEFVPSSPGSLDGHAAGSEGRLSPVPHNIEQNRNASGFDPAAGEFVPSSTASTAGSNPAIENENVDPVPAAKKEKPIIDFDVQKAIGLDKLGSKVQPTNGIAASLGEKGVGNVDDTAGFMAAARALRQTSATSRLDDAAVPVAGVKHQDEPRVVSVVENYFAFEEPSVIDTAVPTAEGVEGQDGPYVVSAHNHFAPPETNMDYTAKDMEQQNEHHVASAVETPFAQEPNVNDTAAQAMEQIDPKPTTSLFVEPSARANVDDTVGFMTAARSLRRTPVLLPALEETKPVGVASEFAEFMEDAQDEDQIQPGSPEVDPKEQKFEVDDASRLTMSPTEHFVSAATSPEKPFHADTTAHTIKFSRPVHSSSSGANGFPAAYANGFDHTAESTPARAEGQPPANGVSESPEDKTDVDDTVGFLAAIKALRAKRSSSISANAPQRKISDDYGTQANNRANHAPSATAVEDEDRENLITFKTWGAPAPREKPASQVRRIVLTGLPSTWANPTKVCSLIHGGAIEKVNISPSGNAHIYFCDHDACKAFYEKYPNGIGLGPHIVYVEIGQEVDVVSSQLAMNRSMGATRVVRAVGVDMSITMAQLHQKATGSNRRFEKIVDNYVPDEVRIVHFRFCSIDDAVRFRSMLVRDVDWESCNIQYGKDPCELATGFHMD